MNRFGCKECWALDAVDAYEVVTRVPIETYLIDESHYIVSIRTCPSCSQHYLQLTTETVDWEDGDDPVFRTIIPIDKLEREGLVDGKPVDTLTIERIGVGRRSLKFDWPKGQDPSTYWSTGIAVGRHD